MLCSKMIDLVCEDYSDSKSEEQGGEDANEFESFAKAVTLKVIGDNSKDFHSGSDQSTEDCRHYQLRRRDGTRYPR